MKNVLLCYNKTTMRNYPLPLLSSAFVAVLMTLVFCPTSFAQATKATASPAYKAAVAQADGITNKVIDEMWETTDKYWHEGDYNRVVSLIRVCVEADPSFTEAYSTGTWLLWSMGDTKTADAFITYGLSRAPKAVKSDMSYEVGWQFFNTKRYAAAIPHLKRAVDLGAKQRQAYSTLAHAYTRMKRYDESIAVWKLVVRKYPDFGAAKTNLAKVEGLKRGTRTGG